MSLSCTLWTSTGIFHSLVGLAVPELRRPLVRLVTEWNTVGKSIEDRYEREAAFWFQIGGIFMVLQGWAWKEYIKATKKEELPVWWGWTLTALGAICSSIMPESGFWLVLAQGIRIVYRNKTIDDGFKTNKKQKEDETKTKEKDEVEEKAKVRCKGNPQGVTRLFLGNLPFAVDETSLESFLPGVTHIKWITDKETGRFYGSAFVEMDTIESAAAGVGKNGTQFMGRPIKMNYAPARPGDVWPPEKRVISGGGSSTKKTATMTTGGQAGGTGIKAMSEKPADCCKLFIGNLSYDIDDDALANFFASIDVEFKNVRWLHHKDSGDFKGCGFVDFWNTEACEKAATLNGKTLLGRPIRLDWTD